MLPVELKIFRWPFLDRFWVLTVGIWPQSVAQKGPAVGGTLLGHTLGPNPHGKDLKAGPKMAPGRFLTKPETLLRNAESM